LLVTRARTMENSATWLRRVDTESDYAKALAHLEVEPRLSFLFSVGLRFEACPHSTTPHFKD
jgi:hypothetical protein